MCLQMGSKHIIHFDNVDEAREAYKIGMGMISSRRTLRKYLRGSTYRNVFRDNGRVLDVRDYGGKVDLKIRLGGNETSTLKVRDLSIESESLGIIKEFSEKCRKDSVARPSSGDLGSMFAFGYRSKESGDYVSMKGENSDLIRNYNVVSRKLFDKHFPEDVKDIIDADREQNIVPSASMGGVDGISAYCLVSRDLINAGHFDLDTSVGISVFNERIIGKAVDWFFILPNTVVDGESNERAVMIQLFDGCTLCWDGRKIFHCTGTKEVGENNHVYGNYWGGKDYR